MSYLEPHQAWDIVNFADWEANNYKGPIVGRCSCGHQEGPAASSAVSVLMQQHRDGGSRQIRIQQRTERRIGSDQAVLW